jgi:16S rRNA processing protein RimM
VYLVDSQQFGEILIPAIKDVIVKVDLVNKEMRVRLLTGLIESEE